MTPSSLPPPRSDLSSSASSVPGCSGQERDCQSNPVSCAPVLPSTEACGACSSRFSSLPSSLHVPEGTQSGGSSCLSSPLLSPLVAPAGRENLRASPQSPNVRVRGRANLSPSWSSHLSRRRLSWNSTESPKAADAASSICGVTESPEMSAEVYGFVSWIASFAAFLFFFLWAVVPHRYFHQLSITYLIDPYWALAFPVILLICLATTFFLYTAATLLKTQPLESFNLLPDRAHLAVMPDELHATLWRAAALSSAAITDIATSREKRYEDPSAVLPSPPPRRIQVPEIYDLPPGAINRIMFPLSE
ncbi:putative ftsJ-like methyltransferase domain-containing protein [Neospora caninum Liverpool]|uniref:FtsJ-like methyltransferase domain-containing protein, putative n=1 Tax=Neospora caninum (strain Liverpool) TaxID=572307 RepID=F0V7W2_NEOCL|nr:putative ftsJ-like methyltransferase domain-containing protein [Neospora caninum Liverpool]CBZ49803.1 putative ftsJ-like methyltransferase domain-containing protein [Neospora caninum Liverpool]CEL64391.1 TPA: ftsJ-like methyltransferase domain-containing protein, putative [Neospora caninum Liverpool]|eukprot:XP_003879838.1 putative ftsJ-like methyltransferase domain-containing protein [Neospora caninum Liverpool]